MYNLFFESIKFLPAGSLTATEINRTSVRDSSMRSSLPKHYQSNRPLTCFTPFYACYASLGSSYVMFTPEITPTSIITSSQQIYTRLTMFIRHAETYDQ